MEPASTTGDCGRLRVFQAYAAMRGLPFGGGGEWSLEEKLELIAAAGFDGIEVAWTPTVPLAKEATELAADYGLDWSMVCWPVSEEDHALVRRILARTYEFHGRVASREQVQIPFRFEQHRQWLDLFLGWWEEGFRLWRGRSAPDDELVFVSELLPPWYAITGADGKELSGRWEEALDLKQLVRELWQRVEDPAEVAR
jgi:hypothetical protein